MVRLVKKPGRPTWWILVCLAVLSALLSGCSCDGNANSGAGASGAGASGGSGGAGGDAPAGGSGGSTTSVPAGLEAVIVATPPAIPRGDNFQTEVALDGSTSTSTTGKLSYKWDIGAGKLVKGELTDAQISATFEGLDNAPVTLTVSDGDATNSAATVIRLQSPPVVIVPDEYATDAGVTATLDASLSFDRDGDPLDFGWTIIDGPAGAQVTGMAGGKASFSSAVPGDYIIEVVLTAAAQTAFGQTIVHVLPPPSEQVPVGVTVVASPPVAAKGTTVNFQIALSDTPKGPFSVTLRAGSQVIPVNNLAGSAVFDAPGDYPVVADVVAVGRGGRGRASLQVFDPAQPDNGPPQVALFGPQDGARLTATVQATGIASDGDLAAYYLEARQTAADPSEPWQVLHTGTTSVNGGNLGPVEVTLLRQTDYFLRLRAVDRRGHVSSVEQRMTVDYTNPRGNVRFVLTDFKSSFSGPPIIVRRGYDSYDRNVGDFGYGWTLSSSGNGSVTRANTIGQGWDASGTNCIFTFQLTELVDHLITVSIGDQRSFYAPTPQINSCITGGVFVTNQFTKLGGGAGSMIVEHQNEELLIPNGDNNMYRFDDLFDPTKIYDPDDYTVTNADLSTAKFSNHGKGGNPKLSQMRDVNGNGFDVSQDENTITHTSGATIGLTRDAAGLVTALTRPDGKKREYKYNAARELISASDFDGRTLRYFYGPDHVLSRIVGPRGNVVFDARYDDNARVVEVHDGAADTSATTTYDTPNHEETTVLPDGVTDVSTYDDSGNTLLRTMNGIQVEKYEANAQSKTNSFTDATGRTTTLKYDDVNGPVAIDPEGTGEVTLQYDGNGHLTAINSPKGTIAYGRDSAGRMTLLQSGSQDIQLQRDTSGKVSHLEQNGAVIDYEHDAAGYVKSVTAEGTKFNYDINGVGDITGVHYSQNGHQYDITMTVDSDGVPTSTTAMVDGQMVAQQSATLDAEGQIDTDGGGRKLVRDGRGRVQHVIGDGAVTSREYYPTGKVKAIITPEGGRTELSVDPVTGAQITTLPNGDKLIVATDAAGRTISREAPGNQITTYAYDAQGRPTLTNLPDGRKATQTYDAAGRLSQKTYIDGTVEQYTYDNKGALSTLKQGSKPPFTYSYDPISGVLTKIVSPGGATQYRAYNAAGQLEGVSYEGGPPTTLYEYKGTVLAKLTDPAGHARTFTREKLDTVQIETRPSGASSTTTRLPDGTVESVDYDGHKITATVDDNGRLTGLVAEDGTSTEMSYDRDARLVAYTDASGTTSFARDTLGRVLLMTVADGRTLKIGYDKVFGAAKLETPGGADVLKYDATGRVTRVDLDAESGIDLGYDSAGRQTSLTLGQLTVTTDFDGDGLVGNVTTKFGAEQLLSDSITYDDDGRPTAILSQGGQARDFAYDAAERLTKDTDVVYAYDAASNLTGIGPDTFTFDVDDHPLTGGARTFTSDKSGHLLSITGGGDVTLTWDGLGRLVSAVKDGKTVTYGYDATGLLVSRTEGDDSRRFLWTAYEDVPALIEEYDALTGEVLARNTHLGRLIVRKTPDHRYTFVRDSLTNARLVVDETGKVVDTRELTAYGALRSGSITLDMPFGFAGEWTDPVTGFVFMRARWYAPELGRFLSEDPVEPRLEVPITLNRFQYGNGMPTVFVDPLGEQDLIGLISTMAGYGNLQSMSQLTSANYYVSLTSQFVGLGMSMFALDRSGLFKFIQKNDKSWIPSSVIFGLNGSAWGGGVGVTIGVEALVHVHTKNFNGHVTPYWYWGGPGTGHYARKAAAGATIGGKPVDPDVMVIPPHEGGIVGAQAFIGAGFSLYVGLAWDVVHPGAYTGPFSALSAPPALLVPFLTLAAATQMDGAGQLAAMGLFAGSTAFAIKSLAFLGPKIGALIDAGFAAIAAGNANPGQIWTKKPPPTTAAFNQAAQNVNEPLKSWANAASISFSFSPYASDTPLCQWDAQTNQWINCVPAQTWSLTLDRSSWFGAKLFNGKNSTINPVTAAPQLFSYTFTTYWCMDAINLGQGCDDKVDIHDDKGLW